MWLSDNAIGTELLHEKQQAGAKERNYSFQLRHGEWSSQRILAARFQTTPKDRILASEGHTNMPSKTQNATLHPLAEADAVTHAPFPFLSETLKVSSERCWFVTCPEISIEEKSFVLLFKLLHP